MEEVSRGAGSGATSVMGRRRSWTMIQFQGRPLAIPQGTLELGCLFRVVPGEDKRWGLCASTLSSQRCRLPSGKGYEMKALLG